MKDIKGFLHYKRFFYIIVVGKIQSSEVEDTLSLPFLAIQNCTI